MSQPGIPDPLPLDGPLWTFALAVYTSDGVSDALIALQDHFEADVNLLLFGAWLGVERGIILTNSDAEQARNLIAAWNDEVVRPLRALRRKLKIWPAPALGGAVTSLRGQIKAAELHSERLELAWLEHYAAAWNGTSGIGTADAVMRNLGTILALTAGNARLASASRHLGIISGAACRPSSLQPG